MSKKISCSEKELRLIEKLMENPKTFDSKYESLKKAQVYMESITPAKFVSDPYFLGRGADNLWKKNKDTFIEIAEDKRIEIIVLTGSIGWGKGYLASVLYAWYLFEFLRYRIPQSLCGLSVNSPMYATITSLSAKHAKKGFYKEIRGMLKLSPFFSEKRPYDKRVSSELVFKNSNHGDVVVMPSAPDALSDIGLNLFLCLIDEWSFMEKIKDSKRAEHGANIYDQAQRLFENLRRRVRNRTEASGEIMGKIIIASSANYEGDPVDVLAKKREGDPTVKIVDHTEYMTKPGAKSQPVFYCFRGDIAKKIPPRIFDDIEEAAEYPEDLVEPVMMKYKSDFQDNIYASIRDILGKRTSISSHLFPDKTVIDEIFYGGREIFPPKDKLDNISLLVDKIIPYLKMDSNYSAHFDLAKNKCFAGFSLSRADGLIPEDENLEANDTLENRIKISVDYLLSIDKDDLLGEVSIPATEDLIFELINRGVRITSISWDGFQSQGSHQRFLAIIRHCEILSIDRDKTIYYNLLRLINRKRIRSNYHKTLDLELKNLLDLPGSKKITKGPIGSKDLSDSMSSGCFQICKHAEDFVTREFNEFDFYEAGGYNSNIVRKNSNEMHGKRITTEKAW